MSLIRFQFYDANTRRLEGLERRTGTIQSIEVQLIDHPEKDYVLVPDDAAFWDPQTHVVDLDGNAVPLTNPPQSWVGSLPGQELPTEAS